MSNQRLPLYRALAQLVTAIENCRKSVGNSEFDQERIQEWIVRHTERLNSLVKTHMPSGSGIDNGCTLVLEKSTGEKLVFDTSFHHMNESGSYDGWTRHTVTVKPSLSFDTIVTIGGRDRNDIKDYLAQVIGEALDAIIDPYPENQ